MIDAALREKCRRVRVVVTDVDGVLTDGGMYYGELGEEFKKFNIRDGAGVALLTSAGLRVGAMTGESRALVARRVEKMGMDFLLDGVRHKLSRLTHYATANGFALDEVAYLGDEINDVPLLGKVGIFFAVSDAGPEILRDADVVLVSRGGEGALREAAGIVLGSQGKMEAALAEYLRRSEAGADSGKLHEFEREHDERDRGGDR